MQWDGGKSDGVTFFPEILQESSLDNLAQPLQFLGDFVRPKKSSSMADEGPKSATVLDVCSGATDHINLKQVVSWHRNC